jgi:hypothetical protein
MADRVLCLCCALSGKGIDSKVDEKQLDAFLHADRGDKVPPIHELVRLLIRQQKGLSVLTESKMAEFVDDYVNRKDLDSIAEGVGKSIKQMTGSIKAEPTLTEKVTTRCQRREHNAENGTCLFMAHNLCGLSLLRVVQDGIKSDDVDRLIRKKHSEMTAAGE